MPSVEVSFVVNIDTDGEVVEPWLLASAGISKISSSADQIDRIEVRDDAGHVHKFSLEELAAHIDADEAKAAQATKDSLRERGYLKE